MILECPITYCNAFGFIPALASLEKFIFTDTVSEGLDFTGTADECITAIETSTDGTQWTPIAEDAVTSKEIAGKTLTVTFDPAKIQQRGYKYVRVQYQAELNEKAVVAINNGSNVNTFTVDYTNNPGIDKPTAEATVDTYGFTLQKNNEKIQRLQVQFLNYMMPKQVEIKFHSIRL